ncbi:unnamed protein product [Mycena citricolor]|uniref:Uncharacterized protein n=1 Tax=Mycena citricolor TaxID=2018698 RepID=A0AAD2H2S4_9AGAR|nr:unnamed protein product [Mycena citricolor]
MSLLLSSLFRRVSLLLAGLCFILLCIPGGKPQSRRKEFNDEEVRLGFPMKLNTTSSSSFKSSFTAILPITDRTFSNFEDLLDPFFSLSSCVTDVLIACPESLLPQARLVVRQIVLSSAQDRKHVDMSLYSWNVEQHSSSRIILEAASKMTTDWLLLLDEEGLSGLTGRTRDMLLCPASLELPIGSRGVFAQSGSASCVVPSPDPTATLYLKPPFSIPRALIKKAYKDWAELGRAISSPQDGIGGVMRGWEGDGDWCSTSRSDGAPLSVTFVFVLSSRSDLSAASHLICRLLSAHHEVRILLHSENEGDDHMACDLTWDGLADSSASVLEWLDRLDQVPDVLFAVEDLAAGYSARTVIVRVPREDLAHTSWMGSMSYLEWINWNMPTVELSIITQDRPGSLQRLLTSLSKARYFGDSVVLRTNMEQSPDTETLQVLSEFQWKHGPVFAHRRIIHAGLMPAVVESWYPSSNDSFGVLLEDDIEVSALFYAWIKMTVLRYRYSEQSHLTKQLFGVSLYQQKNIELHPESRKSFNARSYFARNRIAEPTTPYLSQIPCSWGAVYFPEHWREFHGYLAERFSQAKMDINQPVVPGVRSNTWTRSWKKYFIEMVYLRGYVMLYPNFASFMSLSTNHLEVGSHVKDRSKEKQRMFSMPLIGADESWRLLDLPGERLPAWNTLPVLNLTGSLTTLEHLASVSMPSP